MRQNVAAFITLRSIIVPCLLLAGLLVVSMIEKQGNLVWAMGSVLVPMAQRKEKKDGAAGAVTAPAVLSQQIIQALPGGVEVLDEQLRLIAWNPALLSILGVEASLFAETSGPTNQLENIMNARGDRDVAEAWREILKINPDVTVLDYQARLCTGQWVECKGSAVAGVGYVNVFYDITEQMARELELHGAYERVETAARQLADAAMDLEIARENAEQAKSEAEEANRSKSAFLANMSHELRTPLNAIIGFSEVIRDLHLGRENIELYQEYATDIHDSGEHLLNLINTILDLAKVESGKMELWEEELDVGALLRSALRMTQTRCVEHGLKVDFSNPPKGLHIWADNQKMLQAVLNVLSNAIKFTPSGGVITVFVESSPEIGVIIAIKDTGIGIKVEDIPRVFNTFEQIDSQVARKSKGSGLGMPLTRQLMELHGGRVFLNSAVGEGTIVYLTLPPSRLNIPTESNVS